MGWGLGFGVEAFSVGVDFVEDAFKKIECRGFLGFWVVVLGLRFRVWGCAGVWKVSGFKLCRGSGLVDGFVRGYGRTSLMFFGFRVSEARVSGFCFGVEVDLVEDVTARAD